MYLRRCGDADRGNHPWGVRSNDDEMNHENRGQKIRRQPGRAAVLGGAQLHKNDKCIVYRMPEKVKKMLGFAPAWEKSRVNAKKIK